MQCPGEIGRQSICIRSDLGRALTYRTAEYRKDALPFKQCVL